MDDSIHERGRAMEDLFFQQKDQQLLARMKQDLIHDESRQALAAASGINDQEVLDILLENQITPATLTAVGLIPLVIVAWADDQIQEGERKSVLKAAEESGLTPDSLGLQLLQQWLEKKPESSLLSAWQGYIRALKSKLDRSTFQNLKQQVIGRAESIANAAGGFLGLGNRISESEQEVLDELTKTFDA